VKKLYGDPTIESYPKVAPTVKWNISRRGSDVIKEELKSFTVDD